MQKEILFDALTAQDVQARLERLKALQTEIDIHTAALNAVVLTTGRMSGCAATARLGLNATGTGVVVTSGEVVTVEEEPNEGVNPKLSEKIGEAKR